MPPKTPKNVSSRQKSEDVLSEDVPQRRSGRQSEKKKKEVSETVPNKRKADEILKNEKTEKKRKTESPSVPKEEVNFSPRRSSRGVIPNRKFKDMEVSYTPSKRPSKEDEKIETQKQKTKTPKKQNTPALKVDKPKRNAKDTSTVCAEEKTDSTEISSEEIQNTESSKQEREEESKDEQTQEDSTQKDIPSNKDNSIETKYLDLEEKADNFSKEIPESETSDFSIIKEEDLERITSELLELAQNAEQEHRNIILKNIPEDNGPNGSVSVSVTDMNIIEIKALSDEDMDHSTGQIEIKALSDKDMDHSAGQIDDLRNQCGKRYEGDLFKEKVNLVAGSVSGTMCEERLKSSDDLKDSDMNMSKHEEEAENVIVENIMQRKMSPKVPPSDPVENESQSLDTDLEKENDTPSVEEKIQNADSDEDSNSKSDIIPLSFDDSEIQIAVKNALIQMVEKSDENETEKDAEQETDTEAEKLENVSSSATQTASEGNVIKLPAIAVKPRNPPNVKTITVDVESPYQIDENGQKIKTDTNSKQEFIIVHVPDGQVVKRSTVRINKPEDCIPYKLGDDGIYHCGVCDYSNDKKINLLKHRKKHIDKGHCCPYCDYKTSTSSNLKRHISIHQDIRNFRCHLCNTTFRQKIHLERHIRYRHEEKKVKCPLCDYICANENPDLKVHMKRRHLPQDSEDGSVTAFKCSECDLVTVNRKDFKQHMKFHRAGPELKLFCEYCSFVTDCESRLRRHSYIHTKEKPFKCGMCEYRATQKEHVVRHMRSQHGIEIEKNRRKLDDEDSLDGSIDSRDDASESKESSEQKVDKFDYSSQEKIFACNHCSMKFAKLLNLYKHLHAQHKDILPEQMENEFLCVVCDFKTTTKKNLLVHMRKHNQVDQIPPSHVYSCVLCNYINPKRRNLFQHMKKKHGIEIVMKDDGSTSCFVTDGSVIASKCDEAVQNILTIGDVVTTETEEQELQIVTDDLEKDGIQVQNVISFDDIAYAVSHPQPHNRNLIVVEPNSALLQEHEAAEAIEGLQALAEQPGIVVGQEVMTEVAPQLMTIEDISDDKCKSETKKETLETDVGTENEEGTERTEMESGIQLSAEEVMHLSAGDYVEIDGEMYKVEISEDTSQANNEVVSSS